MRRARSTSCAAVSSAVLPMPFRYTRTKSAAGLCASRSSVDISGRVVRGLLLEAVEGVGAENSVRWLGTVASALGVASAGFTVVIVIGYFLPLGDPSGAVVRTAGALTESNAIGARIVPGLRRISARHGGCA